MSKDHVISPGILQSVFGRGVSGAPVDSGGHPYYHTHEKQLLLAIAETLIQSGTGAHLMGVAESYRVGVRIIKNRNAHGYAASLKLLYLGLPPDMEEPDALAVLELAGALREIEQEILGFTVPDSAKDPLGSAHARHAKFLDIIVHICKTAIELSEKTSQTSFITAVEDLGHGDVMRAWLSQAENEELATAYVTAQKKMVH